MIQKDKWEWFGTAGHFLCGQWCRFHLTTKIGQYLISTVGEYIHPMHSGGSERKEAAWLEKNWPGYDIGDGRKYETMVFIIDGLCSCGCGMPGITGHELAFHGYNDAKAARDGHMKACFEFANKPRDVTKT